MPEGWIRYLTMAGNDFYYVTAIFAGVAPAHSQGEKNWRACAISATTVGMSTVNVGRDSAEAEPVSLMMPASERMPSSLVNATGLMESATARSSAVAGPRLASMWTIRPRLRFIKIEGSMETLPGSAHVARRLDLSNEKSTLT